MLFIVKFLICSFIICFVGMIVAGILSGENAIKDMPHPYDIVFISFALGVFLSFGMLISIFCGTVNRNCDNHTKKGIK